jgi:hypothetical protein
MRTSLARLAAAPALCFAASAASAGTVTPGDVPGGTGGVPYTMQIDLTGPGDSVAVVGGVGAKSWADPMNPDLGSFGLDAGWTHTSNWIHLELAAEADVTILLAWDAEVSDGMGGALAGNLVPAFSVWTGADNDGTESHFYEQGAVPSWIDEPGFAFFDHVDVGPGPFAAVRAVLHRTFPAGVYTIAVGGHDEVSLAHQVGYALEIAAIPVPEPGAVLLLAIGAAVLAACRRC